MSASTVPPSRHSPADIVGIPAEQLSDTLDHVLAVDASSPAHHHGGLYGLSVQTDGLPLPAADGGEDHGHEDLLPQLRMLNTVLTKNAGGKGTVPPPRFSDFAHDERRRRQRRWRHSHDGDEMPPAELAAPFAVAETAMTPPDESPAAPTAAESPLKVRVRPRRHPRHRAPPPMPEVDQATPPQPAVLEVGVEALPTTVAATTDSNATPPKPKSQRRMRVKSQQRKAKAAAETATTAEPSPPPSEAAAPSAGPEPEANTEAKAPRQRMRVKSQHRRSKAKNPAAEPAAETEPAPKSTPELKVQVTPRRQRRKAPPVSTEAQTANTEVTAAMAEPPPEQGTAEPTPAATSESIPATPATEAETMPDAVVPVATPDAAPPAIDTVSPDAVPPEVETRPPPAPTSALAAQVEAVIASHWPEGQPLPSFRGETILPDNEDALAALLDGHGPVSDFAALDLLYTCWPKNTHECQDRALLAVAQQLSRNFGMPDKLPMASSKAWRMLDGTVFAPAMAQRLTAIDRFITEWQKTQRVFLILEFSEIELIEFLFEALPPSDYPELLAEVMNFKVLSNRRMGLLRRIPARLRRQTQPLLPDRKQEALLLQAHGKALLQRIATPGGYAPLVEVASKMIEEVEKLMKHTAAAGAPPQLGGPPGGGQALGRIG